MYCKKQWLCLRRSGEPFTKPSQKVVWEGVDSGLDGHRHIESSSTEHCRLLEQNSWEAT